MTWESWHLELPIPADELAFREPMLRAVLEELGVKFEIFPSVGDPDGLIIVLHDLLEVLVRDAEEMVLLGFDAIDTERLAKLVFTAACRAADIQVLHGFYIEHHGA